MWERLTEPPIVGAIIVLIGAAIIAPLFKKFYFDVQNRLRVEVRAWNFKTSSALKKAIGLERQFGDPVRIAIGCNGYTTVTIINISKKKISGVSVTVPYSPVLMLDMIWQIDDAEEFLDVKKGQAITIGDIQPKHSRVIHIWSNADMSDCNFFTVKQFLRISADELDSVRFRFPMPWYLGKKYELRLIWTFNFVTFTSVFISLYFGFVR